MTKIHFMHIQNITMEFIIPYNQQILIKMQVNNLPLWKSPTDLPNICLDYQFLTTSQLFTTEFININLFFNVKWRANR